MKKLILGYFTFFQILIQKKYFKNIDFFQRILFALVRNKSTNKAKTVFNALYSLEKEGIIDFNKRGSAGETFSPYKIPSKSKELKNIFFVRFSLFCFAHNENEIAEYVAEELLRDGLASADDFLPGIICKEIFKFQNSQKNHLQVKLFSEELAAFYNSIGNYSIADINYVIKTFSKFRMVNEIFHIFDILRTKRIKPNSETLEYLSNAIVLNVDKGIKADSMKELPKFSATIPEVYFSSCNNLLIFFWLGPVCWSK
jgi:hypothetical protein